MKKEIVSTDKAPKAIGPYSQAVRVGNLVFLSGQIPMDPATGELVGGDIRDQARRVLENVKWILDEIGLRMENVVKATLFLKDMGDFSAVNEVYGEYFHAHPPARACVEVARLPKDVGIEMEAIAFSPSYEL